MTRKRISSLALSFFLITLSGCSAYYKPTPEVRVAIVRVTEEYITAVVSENNEALESLVLWDDFVRNNNSIPTKNAALAQLKNIKTRWTPAEHPLLNLDLLGLEIREDTATVELRRVNLEAAPVIKIDFLWAGGGWMVLDDTIFGSDGVLGAQANPRG